MRQPSPLLWFTLCLGSILITLSLVTGTSVKASQTPNAQEVSQANSPAAKVGNVGGSLSQQLQGKPVVVDIYATWCGACKNIAPTLSQLKQQYGDTAHFVVFDVSDQSKASAAAKEAEQLGLADFFAANKAQTGMVAIIDPATGDILAQHRNNTNLSDYTSVLNMAISQK